MQPNQTNTIDSNSLTPDQMKQLKTYIELLEALEQATDTLTTSLAFVHPPEVLTALSPEHVEIISDPQYPFKVFDWETFANETFPTIKQLLDEKVMQLLAADSDAIPLSGYAQYMQQLDALEMAIKTLNARIVEHNTRKPQPLVAQLLASQNIRKDLNITQRADLMRFGLPRTVSKAWCDFYIYFRAALPTLQAIRNKLETGNDSDSLQKAQDDLRIICETLYQAVRNEAKEEFLNKRYIFRFLVDDRPSNRNAKMLMMLVKDKRTGQLNLPRFEEQYLQDCSNDQALRAVFEYTDVIMAIPSKQINQAFLQSFYLDGLFNSDACNTAVASIAPAVLEEMIRITFAETTGYRYDLPQDQRDPETEALINVLLNASMPFSNRIQTFKALFQKFCLPTDDTSDGEDTKPLNFNELWDKWRFRAYMNILPAQFDKMLSAKPCLAHNTFDGYYGITTRTSLDNELSLGLISPNALDIQYVPLEQLVPKLSLSQLYMLAPALKHIVDAAFTKYLTTFTSTTGIGTEIVEFAKALTDRCQNQEAFQSEISELLSALSALNSIVQIRTSPNQQVNADLLEKIFTSKLFLTNARLLKKSSISADMDKLSKNPSDLDLKKKIVFDILDNYPDYVIDARRYVIGILQAQNNICPDSHLEQAISQLSVAKYATDVLEALELFCEAYNPEIGEITASKTPVPTTSENSPVKRIGNFIIACSAYCNLNSRNIGSSSHESQVNSVFESEDFVTLLCKYNDGVYAELISNINESAGTAEDLIDIKRTILTAIKDTSSINLILESTAFITSLIRAVCSVGHVVVETNLCLQAAASAEDIIAILEGFLETLIRPVPNVNVTRLSSGAMMFSGNDAYISPTSAAASSSDDIGYASLEPSPAKGTGKPKP